MLTDLKSAKKVTGAKQVTRALKNGTARRVFLAQDADLGSACGIAVGSAVAAVVD